jgi:hypothetical protein
MVKYVFIKEYQNGDTVIIFQLLLKEFGLDSIMARLGTHTTRVGMGTKYL